MRNKTRHSPRTIPRKSPKGMNVGRDLQGAIAQGLQGDEMKEKAAEELPSEESSIPLLKDLQKEALRASCALYDYQNAKKDASHNLHES